MKTTSSTTVWAIALSILMGLAGTAAVLPVQDDGLDEHELDGCDVDVGPAPGNRRPQAVVSYMTMGTSSTEPNDVVIEVVATDTAAATISDFKNSSSNMESLVAGEVYTLTFDYKADNADDTSHVEGPHYDVTVDFGTSTETWASQPVSGSFDPLQARTTMEKVLLRRLGANQKAVRLVFTSEGLKGGFIIRD